MQNVTGSVLNSASLANEKINFCHENDKNCTTAIGKLTIKAYLNKHDNTVW